MSLESARADELDSRWYAVWTRSRQEKVAAEILSFFGVEHYLPLKSEIRQWSDRKQLVDLPLFTGYLFVYVNALGPDRLQVLKVPGIVAFVGNQTGPLPIPHEQIEDIRTVLTAGIKCAVQPLFKEGDRVRVIRGPLIGVKGNLVRMNSESRLFISVDMIQQSVAVCVSPDDVQLVYASPAKDRMLATMVGRPFVPLSPERDQASRRM